VASDDIERRVIDALDATGATYRIIECDPEFADTAAFCERYGYDPAQSANTIIVGSRAEPKQYVACVLLATTRLDVNGVVRRRMGVRKASFASAEETAALTGMAIGGVTPLALPDGLPLWIDAHVLTAGPIIVGGGSRAMKIELDPWGLTALAHAEVVEGLAG
jgi:prolyl-tRNA editing enzyme YbaK/EbsC (Cys-tRNA(Pro) deacylase)